VNDRNNIPTDLYMVRLWRGKSSDGATSLHGKLQHVVSGATSYFDGLQELPGTLEKMMEQTASPPDSEVRGPPLT